MCSPPIWSTRPLLATTASSTTSLRKAPGPASPPPSGAAFPTPTWAAPAGKCLPGAYSCGLVSTEFQGGYWALGDRGFSPFQGGTNIFSFQDSSITSTISTTFKFGIDLRANQMNVGTEAFQDGFWIVGVAGNFTGNSASNSRAIRRPISCRASPASPFMTRRIEGAVTGRRWKIYRPFAEDNWRVTPTITLNIGLAWDMTTPITDSHGRQADYIPTTGKLLIANQEWSEWVGRHQYGLDRTRTPPRRHLEGVWQRQDRVAPRLRHLPRLRLEPGRPGSMAEPALPGRVRRRSRRSTGCAFATSYCATTLAQTPAALISPADFRPFLRRPTPQAFTGTSPTSPRI